MLCDFEIILAIKVFDSSLKKMHIWIEGNWILSSQTNTYNLNNGYWLFQLYFWILAKKDMEIDGEMANGINFLQ